MSAYTNNPWANLDLIQVSPRSLTIDINPDSTKYFNFVVSLNGELLMIDNFTCESLRRMIEFGAGDDIWLIVANLNEEGDPIYRHRTIRAFIKGGIFNKW